jgi:hypothetical protein
MLILSFSVYKIAEIFTITSYFCQVKTVIKKGITLVKKELYLFISNYFIIYGGCGCAGRLGYQVYPPVMLKFRAAVPAELLRALVPA